MHQVLWCAGFRLLRAPRLQVLGDRQANILALVTMFPAWIFGIGGWHDHDVGNVAWGMVLALAGGVLARIAPSLIGWPDDPEDRVQVARDATRLAFCLGILTFVVLLVWGISGACNGGNECPF